jgi:hypothetical protein
MLKKKTTLLAILLVISAAVFSFGFFPQAVESYYSKALYPIISSVLRVISSFLPFAIGDFLYLILILMVIKSVVFFSSKQRKVKADYIAYGLKSLNFLLLIYLSFKLLWGLNYSRPRINEQLQISSKPYQKAQLIKLSSFYIDKLNKLNHTIDTSQFEYDLEEVVSITTNAYNQLAKQQPFFTYKFPSAKAVNNSWLISKMGIEGYYNPLSGEANINQRLPVFVLPFVACHEIAHQLGVAKEDEANLVGYIVASNAKNSEFKFSAYYNMLRYVLVEIRLKYPEDYNAVLKKIPASLIEKFNAEKEFWAKYNGAMSVYMSKTFDQILKLNNQQKGIKSYQDIVLWLVNYHQKDLRKEI